MGEKDRRRELEARRDECWADKRERKRERERMKDGKINESKIVKVGKSYE